MVAIIGVGIAFWSTSNATSPTSSVTTVEPDPVSKTSGSEEKCKAELPAAEPDHTIETSEPDSEGNVL